MCGFFSYHMCGNGKCLSELVGPALCLRLDVMDAIAPGERLDAGIIAWPQFIIINGLEDKGFALLRRTMDEQEPGEYDDDNIVHADDKLGICV